MGKEAVATPDRGLDREAWGPPLWGCSATRPWGRSGPLWPPPLFQRVGAPVFLPLPMGPPGHQEPPRFSPSPRPARCPPSGRGGAQCPRPVPRGGRALGPGDFPLPSPCPPRPRRRPRGRVWGPALPGPRPPAPNLAAAARAPARAGPRGRRRGGAATGGPGRRGCGAGRARCGPTTRCGSRRTPPRRRAG